MEIEYKGNWASTIGFMLIVLALVGLIAINTYSNLETNKLLEENNRLLKQRTHMDSLYIVHLSTCSFYDRTEFRIGYDNYVQKIDSAIEIIE